MDQLSLRQARIAINAAIEKAIQMHVRLCVAVVDEGANLKAFARMDDALIGSVELAIAKARTARLFDMPTRDIGRLSQPGGPIFGIEASQPGVITFGGGVPIRNSSGETIGAIGVAGGSVDDDHRVAEIGAQEIAAVRAMV